MNKNIWLLLLFFLFSQQASSDTDVDKGSVTMQGEIVVTACTISMESRDQSVFLGYQSESRVRHGQGIAHTFHIDLTGCSPSVIKNGDILNDIEIKFDGENDGQYFSLKGDVEGVEAELKEADGTVVVPDEYLPDIPVMAGKMSLNFNIRLIPIAQRIRTGLFFTTVRFYINYI
ncbi:type 1 fimbrial protein [Salmonella enterica]|nr:type 1 fimbrial protein [Salmonella enterica]EKZ2560672.1 type 1 fimbrial protein [Salmonella enterica]